MPKRTRKARLEIFVHHAVDDCFDVRWMGITCNVVDCALVDDVVRSVTGLREGQIREVPKGEWPRAPA